jgi:hypothetical protein
MDQKQVNVDALFRVLMILWFAMLMSLLMFLLVIRFSQVKIVNNPGMSLMLNSIGVVPLAISFLLKVKLLDKSVAAQRPDLVQSAYVVSFAFCEISALLGLIDHFVTGSGYYYLGFAFAGLGMLLHFPQKKHLLAASNREF